MKIIPQVTLPYCDENGVPLKSVGGLKVGDTVYMKVRGQIVAGKVTSTNPFTASGAAPKT